MDMRANVRCVALIIIVAFCAPVLSVAQPVSTNDAEAELDDLNSQALDFYRAGKFQNGIEVAERALSLAEATLGEDHLETMVSANLLGLLYSSQGRYMMPNRYYFVLWLFVNAS